MIRRFDAVVLGTSAGGFAAVPRLVRGLPAGFPLPIVIVQHKMQGHDDDFFIQYLGERSPIGVTEARQFEPVEDGVIHIAPAGYHLLIDYDRTFRLSVDNRVNYSRPSIDVLFESAADVYGAALIGVLLTGANADGTMGMIQIKQRGGMTLVQDPLEAEAREMPASAVHAGVVDQILPLAEIARHLSRLAAA